MKRFVTAVVVAGLLIATTASGAVAKTTKIEATGTATTTGMIPGTETWVGSVQSVRGLVLLQDGVWTSVYLTGPQVVTIHWDIDYDTGRGKMWGSEHHDVTAAMSSPDTSSSPATDRSGERLGGTPPRGGLTAT